MPKIKSLKIKTPPIAGLEIKDIPESARLVVLTGPNGSGKTTILHSLVHAAQHHIGRSGSNPQAQAEYYNAQAGVPVNVYLRTPYRTEHSLTLPPIQSIAQINLDACEKRDPILSSGADVRLRTNFEIILKRVFNTALSSTSHNWDSAIKEWIDPINKHIAALFPGLSLIPPPYTSVHNIAIDLQFSKNGFNHQHSRLSAGEKDVLDLILDLHIFASTHQDSILCIDEPELHIHSALQGSMLEHLFKLVPGTGQLWIATHSIGILHKAMNLLRANRNEVAFIDLSSVTSSAIVPSAPNRSLWQSVLRVAISDLSGLVSPKQIVICEGRPQDANSPKGKFQNVAFDASIYNLIFSDSHPDTTFISAGNCNDVILDRLTIGSGIQSAIPAVDIVRLIDMDNRSPSEIAKVTKEGVRVLSRYSIENYLWGDEVIKKLARKYGLTNDQENEIISAKTSALGRVPGSAEVPHERVKNIDHKIYEACKKIGKTIFTGLAANGFATDYLVPLITPDTQTYLDLRNDIFG